MDCRTFHKHHLAFVDDTLPGADSAAMEQHRLNCEMCARHDSRVRRGLFVARNLDPIEPSPDFLDRLERRLRNVEHDRRPVYVSATRERFPARRSGNASTLGTALLGAAACALLAAGVATWNGALEPGDMLSALTASTVASTSEPTGEAAAEQARAAHRGYRLDVEPGPAYDPREAMMLLATDEMVLDPALVTSASVGLSVWPAIMIPDDLPRAFREAGFSVAGLAH